MLKGNATRNTTTEASKSCGKVSRISAEVVKNAYWASMWSPSEVYVWLN
jgi:hypothetical protein